MIIPSGSGKDDMHTPTKALDVSLDPPPVYMAQIPPVALDESSLVPARPKTPQPKIKATNYVSIIRSNRQIDGTWVINPALVMPTAFLPPLSSDETEDTRRNLYLKTSNAQIKAAITLTRPDFSSVKLPDHKKTVLYVNGSNGAITVKLRTPVAPRLPFSLAVYNINASVTVHLPRSFNGFILLKTTNARCKFSPQTSAELTTISEDRKAERYFLGDSSDMVDSRQGDEVVVETTNAQVRVQYEDEILEKEEGVLTFLGKLLWF